MKKFEDVSRTHTACTAFYLTPCVSVHVVVCLTKQCHRVRVSACVCVGVCTGGTDLAFLSH